MTDGRIIADTKQEGGQAVFAIGTGNTWRCLDLALTQLKPGAKAHIECPSNLVYGSFKAKSPLGGEDIPENSDVNFEVEVESCTDNAQPNLDVIRWGDYETVRDFKVGYCYNFKVGDKFLRYDNAKVFVAANSEENHPEGALFRIQKGLSGDANTISLESLTTYNGFVKNSHGSIRVAVGDNKAYNEDASFKYKELSNGVAFESINPLFPDKYFAISGDEVVLSATATEFIPVESRCPGQEW